VNAALLLFVLTVACWASFRAGQSWERTSRDDRDKDTDWS
jgi:hypothetical protein